MGRPALDPLTLTRKMTEDDLKASVIDAAQKLGFRAYHTRFSLGSHEGFPDLVLLSARKRRTIFAELKGPRGRASTEQMAWLTELVLAGQEAYLWVPDDWHSGAIERVLLEAPVREGKAWPSD